jgi:hypothetical protein
MIAQGMDGRGLSWTRDGLPAAALIIAILSTVEVVGTMVRASTPNSDRWNDVQHLSSQVLALRVGGPWTPSTNATLGTLGGIESQSWVSSRP